MGWVGVVSIWAWPHPQEEDPVTSGQYFAWAKYKYAPEAVVKPDGEVCYFCESVRKHAHADMDKDTMLQAKLLFIASASHACVNALASCAT